MDAQNEFTASPSSGLHSSPHSSAPFWRRPEAVLSVAFTAGLRYTDHLGDEWTAAVFLGAVLGPPILRALEWLERRRAARKGT